MKLNLKYFNATGRGEPIRVMLYAVSSAKKGDFEWTDTRIEFPKWPEEKKLAPLGCLPVLSGLVESEAIPPFCQTPALSRYFARQAGFYPKDDLEALVVDEALETMNELSDKIPFTGFVDEDDKKAKRQAFQSNEMTTFFNHLESRIQTFGDGKRFVKSCWTVADVALWSYVCDISKGQFDYVDTAFFESYPGISATAKGVEEHELVRGYREHAAAAAAASPGAAGL